MGGGLEDFRSRRWLCYFSNNLATISCYSHFHGNDAGTRTQCDHVAAISCGSHVVSARCHISRLKTWARGKRIITVLGNMNMPRSCHRPAVGYDAASLDNMAGSLARAAVIPCSSPAVLKIKKRRLPTTNGGAH